jgi:membrane fusion protein, multidrug efflux system
MIAAALLAAAAARAAEDAEFTVTLQAVDDRKAVFATVESVDVVPARARIGGTIVELGVDEGSRVAKGERIAVVADPKLQAQLAAVEARIQSLEAQRDLAATALDRTRRLRETGTATQSRLDEAETALDVAAKQLVAMQAERRVILEQRSEGRVLAPADGRILRVPVTVGSVILPGETVAIVAAETYVLRMALPERHARYIGVGDEVLVGERGLGAAPLEGGETLRTGRVRQVYPEIQQGRVVADVAVEGLGDFFVGERVRVYVGTGTRFVYVVPPAFLFERYGLTYVRLRDGGDVVVQAGRAVDGGVEILTGVTDDDVLVEPERPR